jgi:hypothetical protein
LEGGLAESTGLLSVGDEIIEVCGISVEGKTIDQVTDMLLAQGNSNKAWKSCISYLLFSQQSDHNNKASKSTKHSSTL